METKIRKYRNILVCAGEGSILFGLWSAVKTILMMTIGEMKDEIVDLLAPYKGVERALVLFIFILAMFVVSAVLMLLHLYVGLTAIREGHGKGKGHCRYLIFVVFFVAYFLHDFLTYVQQWEGKEEFLASKTWDTIAVAVLMDITAIIVYVEIFCSAVYIRLLERKSRHMAAV